MYLLPNGQQIDEQACLKALEGKLPGEAWFDAETGQVGANGVAGDRFFRIDPVTDATRAGWIEGFCEFVACEDEKSAEIFWRAAQDGTSMKNFEAALEKAEGGWGDAWQLWQDDMVVGEFGKFLDALPMMVDEKIEWDDDCDVCRYMHEMEESGLNVNADALKEVMHRANADADRKKNAE